MKILLFSFNRNRIRRQHLRRDVAEIIEPLQQPINLPPRLRQRPPHLRRDVPRNRLAVRLKITERPLHTFHPLRQRDTSPIPKRCPRLRRGFR